MQIFFNFKVVEVCKWNTSIRYHDYANWPTLHEALKKMGREDLIGNCKKHLVPAFQPTVMGCNTSIRW